LELKARINARDIIAECIADAIQPLERFIEQDLGILLSCEILSGDDLTQINQHVSSGGERLLHGPNRLHVNGPSYCSGECPFLDLGEQLNELRQITVVRCL